MNKANDLYFCSTKYHLFSVQKRRLLPFLTYRHSNIQVIAYALIHVFVYAFI